MLTLEEVLSDAAMYPSFRAVETVTVNSRGGKGETPLHWMATLGDVAGIHLLLDANAKINAIDSAGNTPLHEAVASRQTSAAQCLVDRGADRFCRNTSGLTPLDVAKADGFGPTIELLSPQDERL